jgi:hypothetical protein
MQKVGAVHNEISQESPARQKVASQLPIGGYLHRRGCGCARAASLGGAAESPEKQVAHTSPARRIPEYRRAGGLHVLLPDSLGKVSADEAYDVAVAGAVQINARLVMKTMSYQKSRKTDESGKPKVRTAAAVTEVGHGGRVRGAPSGVLEPSCNVGSHECRGWKPI